MIIYKGFYIMACSGLSYEILDESSELVRGDFFSISDAKKYIDDLGKSQ